MNSVGVKTKMVERGQIEEKGENSWRQRSLGIIAIPEGSIRWINSLKGDRSDKSPHQGWVVLSSPDEMPVSNRQQIKIKTVNKKTFPLFGKVMM